VVKTHGAFIWSVADLLRGDYRQSEYGRVILPFTVLRRLDCVLEPTKDAVVKQYGLLQARGIENIVNGQVEVPAGGHEKSPPLDGFSGGCGGGAGSSRAGLFHAVGLAFGGDDDGVVQEPVEEADGGGVLGQEPSPVLEGPVRSDAE